mgnify:CR=1 FL=1
MFSSEQKFTINGDNNESLKKVLELGLELSGNKDMFGKNGRLVRCEIAAEVGLAFKWNGLQGRISYQHTLNNDNRSKYTFTLPMKNVNPYHTQGTVKLSVAYLFDLRK